MWATYVNVGCNILLLYCVYFNYRRANQNFELLCEAQGKQREAERATRFAEHKMRFHSEHLDAVRGERDLYLEKYKSLWAETHLGEYEHGVEIKDDGRS